MDDKIFNYYAATFYFIRGVIGVAIITAMISRRNIWKVDRGGEGGRRGGDVQGAEERERTLFAYNPCVIYV